MTGEPVSRAEWTELVRRLDQMDLTGTRGVAIIAVQMQQLSKDVGELEKDLRAHRQEHSDAERQRQLGRRWLVGIVIGAVASIDVPNLVVLLSSARGR